MKVSVEKRSNQMVVSYKDFEKFSDCKTLAVFIHVFFLCEAEDAKTPVGKIHVGQAYVPGNLEDHLASRFTDLSPEDVKKCLRKLSRMNFLSTVSCYG